MCGIAGEIISWPDGAERPNHITRMVDALDHRGPDERGYLTRTVANGAERFQVNLGMSRLAIIDRQHGQQPMGRGCKVCFNGEIYNHAELRDELCHYRQFLTHCDTEAIAHAYEIWGADFVGELDGMFAIAIWDEIPCILSLYRDRVGKKPLYYYHDSDKKILLFASEIKAILLHPAYKKAPNYAGLYHYITLQYVPEPQTAFEGIRCVLPGHRLTYDPLTGCLKDMAYWDWSIDQPELSDRKARTQVAELVTAAVDKRLESEVPLGVYLSGGIDSAIITALAARSERRPEELHTFTMAFAEDQYNEAPLAQVIADEYKTIHHVERVPGLCLQEMAQKIVDQYDQPFGDCSAIPTMLLAKLSKQYITVALSGDGGDEAFGGYPRYWMSKGEQRVFFSCMMVWPPTLRDQVIAKTWRDKVTGQDTMQWLLQKADQGPANDPWNRQMYADIVTYLPNDIIVKMERATMAYSVEARCPFLDSDVLDLSLSIPSRLKLNADSGKQILKDTFAHLLPAKTLQAPKRGFSVPVGEWLRQKEGFELLAKTIMDKSDRTGLFDRGMLNTVVTRHMARKDDYGHGIWILIMLDMWWRKHFGN